MKKLVGIAFVLMFLSSCETAEQLTQAVQKNLHLKYDYKNIYVPYEGKLNVANYEQSITICNFESQKYGAELVLQQSSQNSQTTYNCSSQDWGFEVKTNCTASNESAAFDSIMQGMDQDASNTDPTTVLMVQFHRACMAEKGYKITRVCMKNCDKFK